MSAAAEQLDCTWRAAVRRLAALVLLPLLADDASAQVAEQPPAPIVQPQGVAPADEDDLPALPPQRVIGDPGGGESAAAGAPPGEGAPNAGGFAAPPEVTAPTTLPIEAGQFGGTVRVIDAQTIANSKAFELSEVLRSVPGVDVVRQGPPGSISSVFLRGANSQHTKVLLNGIPLNEPSGPSRGLDFSTLSLDNVERIEVLQGPQSPLYGSDAVGGVVNIVTRRGRTSPGSGARITAGSFGTHRESAFARGAGRSYDYSLGGSWLDTDGFSSAAPRVGGRERDGLQLGTLDGRFGLWCGEAVEAEYLFRWIDGRTDIDDAPLSLGTPPADDPFRKVLNQQFFQRVLLRAAPGEGLIEHVATFDLTDFERDDVDDLFPFSTNGQSRRGRYQANLLLAEGHVLTAGGAYWAEDAGSVGFGSTVVASQHQRSAFLQDQWSVGRRVFATAGVRWDEHSAAGSAFTYRLTLLGDLWETGTRVRGSLGTGFRAPALAENLFPFGNPALAPETSRGWEYGLEQRLTRTLTAGAVYFRNDLDNLILFDLATFTLENIGRASTHGVEVTASWQPQERLLVDGSYTRTETLDGDTGAPLVRRPRDKGAATVTWLPADGTMLRAALLAVGPRTDSRDGTVLLSEYALLNVSADRRLGPRLRAFGRVDNLLDEDYEEATGFATAGISFFGGVLLTP